MDLAKIRQKARQGQSDTAPANPPEAQVEVAVRAQQIPPNDSPRQDRIEPPDPAYIDDDLTNGEVTLHQMAAQSLALQSHHRISPFDPIEAILAGRAAANCDEDVQLSDVEQSNPVVDDYEEFLCIRVSDEIYGINIMQIKEIIKPREVTEVPRAPSFVSGVISLRGVIIPVLDMLDRLGLGRESVTGKERVVVVKHGEAFTGLLVDEVIQVVRIAKTSFEPAPSVLEGIDREFVSGIGRADDRMIILLNLDTIADINIF